MSSLTDVTSADFADVVLASPVPVVVDFWATWCGPCRALAPELEALAATHDGAVRFVKVDVDASPDLAGRYGVMSVPTVALFRDGELAATSVGAKPAAALAEALGI